MFDNAKPYYHMTDMVLNRLQDKKALKSHGTKIYGNKFYLKHPFGQANPAVYFDFEEREFQLEASLPKLLQGHNVVGSNRLEYMCLNVAKLIYQQLGLRFTNRECREVREHRIRLGRLDGTCSFRLDSPQQAAEVAEVIWEQFRAEGCNWSAFGQNDFESVYNRQHSTRVTDKFYNKNVELLKNRIPSGVAERDYILEFVRRLLRFEVTWRGKELERLELEYADLWSLPLLKRKVRARLAQFDFQGVLKDMLDTMQLDDLNDGQRMFYELWEQGANLRKHRRYRTLDRARNHLLEHHQVDIYRSAGVGCDIPLREILTVDNAYFTAPKYLTRRGAIFGFDKSIT